MSLANLHARSFGSHWSLFSSQVDAAPVQLDIDTEALSPATFLRRSHIIDYSKQTLRILCDNQDDIEFFIQLYKGETFGRILQKMGILLLDPDKDAKDAEPVID
jgi:hypothetical protein